MRKVHHADAFEWLPVNGPFPAIVTSLPDAAEMGMELDRWAEWFHGAALLCAGHASRLAIFYQTDRKAGGRWHSKAALLARLPVPLLWHKVVLRRSPGAIDLHRPGYAHLMAFGGCGPGPATPDVITGGRPLYKNGVGHEAALFAAQAAARVGGTLCDPFCGQGGFLDAAEAVGMEAIGVDIDGDQCAKANEAGRVA